jgi:pimeloyl-ACP methyl ester carboxylesterase
MVTTVRCGTTTSVNGVDLYSEARGSGPSVLLISGATGDAGHWEQVAGHLADEFTVVTYDRRGNSRSPRPANWTRTSVDEQADDAAGLLRTLGLTPAAAVGTSSGALILLNLLLRHPDVLRGALVHEPPLIPVLADPQAVMAPVQSAIQDGMAAGGPPQALEAFLRFAGGDAVYNRLDPELRERMLGNAETFFEMEFGRLEEFFPDATALAAVKVPAWVLVSRDSDPLFREACTWLTEHSGWRLREIPGAHAPYLDRPDETAEALRPLLRAFA